MPNNLKVLHVIPSVSPSRGGPSKAVIAMVKALIESGVDAEIATTNDHGNETLDVPLHGISQYEGVPIRFFKRFSPTANAIREFAYSRDFQRWIKKNISNYDLIHVHAIFSFCSTYAMYQARKQGVNYIVRPIGQLETWSLSQSERRKNTYLKLIEQRNLIEANTLHFTSESEKKQALNTIPKLNATVIPLGINMPKRIDNAASKMHSRWDLKENIPTIIFLSRLHPKKGLELLISSLGKLNEVEFQLIIAGEGEQQYTDQLNETVAQNGLSKICQLIGFVEGHEKNLLLQGADLFVLTSHSENFGIAVLEAMASNTAVLVSNEVALSKQIEQHQLGYTTSLDESNITNTLRKALTQLQATKTMGNDAYRFAQEHYQWSVINQEIMRMYQSVHTH